MPPKGYLKRLLQMEAERRAMQSQECERIPAFGGPNDGGWFPLLPDCGGLHDGDSFSMFVGRTMHVYRYSAELHEYLYVGVHRGIA
jgi:hypothetical protein